MRARPHVCIVSPALAEANNGNWHTAKRWAGFLAGVAEVEIALAWEGGPAAALIALHARRSAGSIRHFRAAHPDRPIALVLTGTDLYRDLQTDPEAQHALECASQLVVLQPEGLNALPAAARAKARVIVQSAPRQLHRGSAPAPVALVAVGHLRDEKDPLTLMAAAGLLPPESAIRIEHIGRSLDPALGAAARLTMQRCPRYQWLGGLEAAAARRAIARAHALVHMSRIEGGANVVIEAIRSQVPVLASRIDGNVGLLGADYDGYFPVGSGAALAALMRRFEADAPFAAHLRAQCRRREPDFVPAAERRAVRALLFDMPADTWNRPGDAREDTLGGEPSAGADATGADTPGAAPGR